MALATVAFDAAELLETPEDVAEFLSDAFESGDPRVISHALGIVARAKGMAQVAKETGLSRQSLYRSLSADGRPELATVLKVLEAVGVRLKPALAVQATAAG